MGHTGYFQYQPSQIGLFTAGQIKIIAITGQPIFTNPLGGHLRKISPLYSVFPSTEEALEKKKDDELGTDVSAEAFL